TEDDTRWVNGVRFKTKAEAAAYAARTTTNWLRPLWELDEEPLIVVRTRVLASADAADFSAFPKKNGGVDVDYPDGGCHLLRWHREKKTDPISPAATAATDDGLDIPDCLRRAPKAV